MGVFDHIAITSGSSRVFSPADAAARGAIPNPNPGDESVQQDDGSHWLWDGSSWVARTGNALGSHVGNTSNPHSVTAAQAGADPAGTGASEAASVQGNLDTHTGDSLNPHTVTAVQVNAVPSGEKGAPNGVATLDAFGKVEVLQIPKIAISETFVVASEVAMLALAAETGDVAIRSDLPDTFILQGADPSVLGNWKKFEHPVGGVSSIQGLTGIVSLDSDDIPEGAINEYYSASKVSAHADVVANTAAKHTHANKAELDLVSDGDHDVRLDNPHNVLAGQVSMGTVGAPTYSSVQHAQDVINSAGLISGGGLTDLGGENLQVAAGSGLIRSLNDPLDPLVFIDWPQAVHNIPTNTVRYLGVEYNGGSPIVAIRAVANWNLRTDFPIGRAINESGALYLEFSPQVVGDHIGAAIRRIFEVDAIRRDRASGGLILGESGTRNITLSSGAVWKRLTRYSVPSIDTSVSGSFDGYYSNGGVGWTKQSPMTQWPNSKYDDGSGTLATLQASYYGVLWFYLGTDGSLTMVYGTSEYPNLLSAELGAPPAEVPDRSGCAVGRLIFQNGATTAKIQTPFVQAFPHSEVPNHSSLLNLGVGDPHTQYQLGSDKGVPNGYASLDVTGKVPLSELPPLGSSGGYGWVRIVGVEVQPSAGGSESGHVWQDPSGQTILQSLTVSDGQIRVHVEASYPIVDVDGNPLELSKVGDIYTGFVDFTHPASGNVAATVSTPDDAAGAVDTVLVTIDAPPAITAAVFTGGYPGTQSELKSGDNFGVSVTADKLFDRLRVVDFEACQFEEFVVSPAALSTIKDATIADRGDVSVKRPVRVQVRDASTAAWSNTFDSGVQGAGVDGAETVFCNDLGPSVVFGAKTYPGSQEALKDVEQATIGVAVSEADIVNWDSPGTELTILNPNETPAFDVLKTVTRLAGNYNVSSNNLRATATRAANDKVSVFQANIAIAHVAAVITVSEPAARLRSGGNDGTAEQLHTISINSNQQLHSSASPSVGPALGGGRASRGVFQGLWVGGPSTWTRSLGVHDDDGKGTFGWVSLSGVLNKAEVPTTVISGDSSYVLGGFVSRDVAFAAFTANGNAAVQAVDFSKLTATSFTNGNPGVKQPIGAPDTSGAGEEGWWTIISIGVSPTVVRMLHIGAVSANSGGVNLQGFEETV